MNRVKVAYNFLKYRIKAVDEHGVHSPFVFELLVNAVYSKSNYYFFEIIEKLRNKLKQNHNTVNHLDLGAGSNGTKARTRKISEITKTSAKSSKHGQLLFRLVNYFQPKTIIELGSSLGISTCYLAAANKNARVFTFEGSPEIGAIAKKNFDSLSLYNIDIIEGDFKDTLPKTLNNIETIDFVFFDGNHRHDPTIDYFNLCLSKVNNNTVFVFDDIYWSGEMTKAWEEIKAHPQTKVTIDLFQMGIVFFRKELTKQHFVVRF